MKSNKIGILVILLTVVAVQLLPAQNPDGTQTKLKNAALNIMSPPGICAFITIDQYGKPVARMMDAFGPDSNFVAWLGTNPRSRKVKDIEKNPSVCLYYTNPAITGYVMIQGNAILVNDPIEKNNRWKTEWQEFYKSREKDYILIKVTPSRLEVVNYNSDITGDSQTWEVPFIEF